MSGPLAEVHEGPARGRSLWITKSPVLGVGGWYATPHQWQGTRTSSCGILWREFESSGLLYHHQMPLHGSLLIVACGLNPGHTAPHTARRLHKPLCCCPCTRAPLLYICRLQSLRSRFPISASCFCGLAVCVALQSSRLRSAASCNALVLLFPISSSCRIDSREMCHLTWRIRLCDGVRRSTCPGASSNVRLTSSFNLHYEQPPTACSQ